MTQHQHRSWEFLLALYTAHTYKEGMSQADWDTHESAQRTINGLRSCPGCWGRWSNFERNVQDQKRGSLRTGLFQEGATLNGYDGPQPTPFELQIPLVTMPSEFGFKEIVSRALKGMGQSSGKTTSATTKDGYLWPHKIVFLGGKVLLLLSGVQKRDHRGLLFDRASALYRLSGVTDDEVERAVGEFVRLLKAGLDAWKEWPED